MQYKTLTNLFQSTPELNQFLSKLEQLQKLSHAVATNLEPQLAAQCRVANIRNGSLILSTNSPAWNHKLRFATLELLSKLRTNPEWCGLKSIEVRVDYHHSEQLEHNKDSSESPYISKDNSKLLQTTATNISCSKLAAALQRLAEKTS